MGIANEETLIGQGGFGKVFKIFDNQDNKHYAIKETIENDKLSKSRFITEASNWFLFRSVPQVVEIFEILNEDNKIKIKMEFMQNGSLRDYIRNKNFSYNDRIIALYDILMALIECNRIDNNFCHLDIKPENCLISKYGLTKLSDFGSSVINENNFENVFVNDIYSSILDSNNYGVIGTPLYMAPEQIKGLPDIGIKSDIYSFGLMAIETLNAIHPFVDIGTDNIYKAHIKGLFMKKFKLSKKIPKTLRKILKKTIDTNPNRRPSLSQIETAFFKSMNSKLKHRRGVNKRLPDYVDDAIRKSKSLIAISKLVKAEKVLLDALEFNPYNAEAWCELGLIKSNKISDYHNIHSLSAALDCFIRALIINNGDLSEKYSTAYTELLINLLETDKYDNYELDDLLRFFKDKNSKWLIEKEKEYLTKTYNKEYCLCVKCGEMKDYIFDRCSSCGYLPHTDNDVFNSHNLKVRRIKDDISTNLYIKSKYLRSIGKNITEFVSNMEKDPNYKWVKDEFYSSKSGMMLKKMAQADSSCITDWIEMIQSNNS